MPGDIRAVTDLVTMHIEAALAAHEAKTVSYGSTNVEEALDTAAGHQANQNNPHGVTAVQAGAVALGDAVATVTANKVVRRDGNGRIAGDITGNSATVGGLTPAQIRADAVPSGMICMWSGSIATIPAGWTLCNGQNGTPDLRDRFIVGAGGSYSVGNTGGSNTVTLTVNQIPSHNHAFPGHPGGSASSRVDADFSGSGTWYNKVVGNTGGGQSHENRPPYYALCYIYKI
ncbi:tail fiber protein [Acetonema longum]|uniref:tail fiber protein n=1 Tax=Acetonema longum TaxID=2374 RepID=UPI0019309AF0|nr:tail fiber protein [Acetonema longum]